MPHATDRAGLIGATPAALDAYEAGVRAFTTGYGDALARLDEARQEAPGFALAHLAKAWVLVLANDAVLAAAARPLLSEAGRLPLDAAAGAHLAALRHAVEGHRASGVSILDRYLMSAPHDLLAQFAAMLMDGFLGRFPLVADRAARALPFWPKDAPGYGILLSFYGFGLEESADYGRAEATSRQAAELEPMSYWPHHAVSHVLEMTGRPDEGLAWMNQREPMWSTPDHAGQAHIWWHKALFHVELGDYEAALKLYDGPLLATQRPIGVSLPNAPALLWRLETLGCDVGERWRPLARLWSERADGRLCVFTDIHAALSESKVGDADAFARRRAMMARTAADGTEAAAIYRDIGLPVVDAIADFERGDYAEAVERLLPARFDLWKMGGSKAQRDLIDWTLTVAATRAGLRDVAVSLANERLAQRPRSAPNRAFLEAAKAV